MNSKETLKDLLEKGILTQTDIDILTGSEEKTIQKLNYNGFFIDDIAKNKLKYVKKSTSCYNSPCDGIIV
jgi:hypothetical protein